MIILLAVAFHYFLCFALSIPCPTPIVIRHNIAVGSRQWATKEKNKITEIQLGIMPPPNQDGSHEINTAKQRLAAAKKSDDNVTQILETAQQMIDALRRQKEQTKKEWEDAKESLKAAEKRWEVIDVDMAHGAMLDETSPKASHDRRWVLYKKQRTAPPVCSSEATTTNEIDENINAETPVEGSRIPPINRINSKRGTRTPQLCPGGHSLLWLDYSDWDLDCDGVFCDACCQSIDSCTHVCLKCDFDICVYQSSQD